MKKKIGYCAICGQKTELTFEHLPPKAAFNSTPAKKYSGDQLIEDNDRMPWEFDGLRYTNQQKGMGAFSLCQSCNNLTGEWYGNSYKEVAHILHLAISHNSIPRYSDSLSNQELSGITLKGVYPLRFVKQILSIFCSINPIESLIGYYCEPVADIKQYHPMTQIILRAKTALWDASMDMEIIRRFVLDKNRTNLDGKKFKLCMYITTSELYKQDGITTKVDIENQNCIALSEFAAYPMGFILYFNPPEDLPYSGTDITQLGNFDYDTKCDITIPFVDFEVNSWIPADFRNRDEIQTGIEEAKDFMQNHSGETNEKME